MTSNTPIAESSREPIDALDRLLSDYFKSQLRQPWPGAPETLRTEVASPAVQRSMPAVPQDNTSRARLTLAASVALLLGACWYFSSGFQSSDRSRPGNSSPAGVLRDAGAGKPDALEELKHDNAIKGEKVPARTPMQLP